MFEAKIAELEQHVGLIQFNPTVDNVGSPQMDPQQTLLLNNASATFDDQPVAGEHQEWNGSHENESPRPVIQGGQESLIREVNSVQELHGETQDGSLEGSQAA